jgi:amidase
VGGIDEVIASEHRSFAFDPALPPVAEIEPPSTVRFEVDDSALARLAGGESPEEIGMENFNAVTGPLCVRGAEPGDALRIEVLDILISRAWSVWLPGFGGLGTRSEKLQMMQTPLEDSRVHIEGGLSVPLEPMIGCIGLAPARGRASTMRPVYPFGGNMDLRELSPGATLWLPVQVAGALLSVGDLHAAMGQGEPTFVGLEAAGAATLRIDLEKGKEDLAYPRLRIGQETICVGMGETHQDAKQSALDQAFELLTVEHGLESFAAYTYASATVSIRLGGPSGTMVEGRQCVLAVVPDPKPRWEKHRV